MNATVAAQCRSPSPTPLSLLISANLSIAKSTRRNNQTILVAPNNDTTIGLQGKVPISWQNI